MKIKVDAKALVYALDVVGIVPPKAINQAGFAGYLFEVRSDNCYIYARDGKHVSRSLVPVLELEGEGAFIYPNQSVSAFKYVPGTITFNSTSDGEKFLVNYVADSGANAERFTVNPKLFSNCEEDLEQAVVAHDFSTGVLRLAFDTVKSYTPAKENHCDEVFHTVQIFDDSKPEWAKGDGVMFAADNIRAIYFECSAFKGKHLPLAAEHLPYVSSFLSKCSGSVSVRNAPHMVFFEDSKGNLLGALHKVKVHSRYSYYPTEKDQFVFRVDKDTFLTTLKYIRTELDKDRHKIRLTYSHQAGEFQFQVSESSSKAFSAPFKIRSREATLSRDFTFGINIDHFIGLFEPVLGNEVELRVSIVPQGAKEAALFRTIDRFNVDSEGKLEIDKTLEGVSECKVTRFMPSMD